jgi:hypothetical protein
MAGLPGAESNGWGGVWQAIVSQVSSLKGSGPISLWSWSPTLPTPQAPGGVQLNYRQGELTYTPAFLNLNWTSASGPGSVGSLVRDALWSAPIAAEFGSEVPTASALVPILWSARAGITDLVAVAAGAVSVPATVLAIGYAGVTGVPVLYRYVRGLLTASDACTDLATVQDLSQMQQVPSNPQPPGPSYSRQSTSPQVIVTVEIPQLIDVAVNRGQAIATLQSRSFTNVNGVDQ